MSDFLQLVISGTAVGAIYALAALGFTLLWQASGTINFAQGEFVMLPAFITLLCLAYGMPLPLAFAVTCLVAMALLGVAFKDAVVDPLRRHGVIPLVIATLGLSIGLKNLVKAGYSAGPQPFPNIFPETLLRLGPLRVSAYDIGALALAGLIVIGLQAFLNRTVTGRAMQAVAQNTEAATVLGIDVKRMVLYVFLINALLAIAFAPLGLKNYGIYLLTLWCVYVMAGMGLNLTVGYAGQMSIGHAAFLGIGAYTAAILMKLGLSFWLVLPVAALLCFAVGLVLGFPALRVQHHYLAFATLGFNVLMSLFFRNEEWLTGGTFGISGIQRPALLGMSLDGAAAYFYFTYVSTIVLAVVALMIWLPGGLLSIPQRLRRA